MISLFISDDLKILELFGEVLILYFIPCLAGSFINFYVKYVQTKEPMSISKIIFFSITPSVLLTTFHTLIKSTIAKDSNLLLVGFGFFCGLVGDEITIALSTLKNLLKICLDFSNLIKTIKKIDTNFDSLMDLNDNDNDETK